MERRSEGGTRARPRGKERTSPSVKQHEHEEEQLDEALDETFPSSDPVAVSVPRKEREWTKEELAEAERKEKEMESATDVSPPPAGKRERQG